MAGVVVEVVDVEAFGAEPEAAAEPAVGASVAVVESVDILASLKARVDDN